jgi:hypothetical protein
MDDRLNDCHKVWRQLRPGGGSRGGPRWPLPVANDMVNTHAIVDLLILLSPAQRGEAKRWGTFDVIPAWRL